MSRSRVVEAWDREYEAGRYEQEPPVAFVQEILDVAGARGSTGERGLYIGWAGLDVHFFSQDELAQLFDGWSELLPVRPQVTHREPVERGQWTQWEAIWQKPRSSYGRRSWEGMATASLRCHPLTDEISLALQSESVRTQQLVLPRVDKENS